MIISNKTFHIITIGCQMNKSDSERIKGYMEMHNFKETGRDKAGVVFITTCGVRQFAEDRIYGLVPEIKKTNINSIIVLTGCLARREDVKKRLTKSVDIWMPINELPELTEKIGIKPIDQTFNNYLNIAPKYTSDFSAYIPIGNGCDNFCSYCVVPYARGREVYRNINEIISEAKSLVDEGFREITLIAQNVNSYKGGSRVSNFPQLLREVNGIHGDFWIRFASSHPKDMSDDLISAVAECDKVCEHIHLPVQAGDDEVLKRMNRNYTSDQYLKLVSKIKNKMPGVSITTDTIVGFPGETEDQFENTVKLYNEVSFDMAYVAQFSPRYGTAASKMKDDVSILEKKRREKILMEIVQKSYAKNNSKLLGEKVNVLVEGVNRKGHVYGKTRTFLSVKIVIDAKDEIRKHSLPGKFVDVEIDKIDNLRLVGKLL